VSAPNTTSSILARFDRSGGPDACHPWIGYVTSCGYGQASFNGEQFRTHVLAFVFSGGVIPDGWHVGHVCHDEDKSCSGGDECPHRRCGNERHLAAMTPGDNIRAGRSPEQTRRRVTSVTHCGKGHEYTEANTYVSPVTAKGGGHRDCRVCIRDRGARYQLRKASA
jgi:hypothetical protein